MASLDEGLIAALLANGGVTALVGSRVYRGKAPQETAYPVVITQRISTQRGLLLDGTPDTLHDVTLRLDIVGRTAASIEAVANAIRPVVDGVTGDFGGATVQHVHVQDETDVDIYEGDQDYLIISLDLMAYLHE